MGNIDDEYKRLVEHLHDCTRKVKSFKTTKKRLSPETLELIRLCGDARATGNQELTSKIATLRREAIKEDLKERRAELALRSEVAEGEKSIPVETSPIVNNNDCSPDPRWNNYSIEKEDGGGHSRLLLRSL
ncbi:hypothetical protein RB195_018612 [Necator americanus]|uniref:Uncharacterized protein n=1 Tax=Necator americanus TaxID=51031 RepID=A0ABR1CAJ5_NECAM